MGDCGVTAQVIQGMWGSIVCVNMGDCAADARNVGGLVYMHTELDGRQRYRC